MSVFSQSYKKANLSNKLNISVGYRNHAVLMYDQFSEMHKQYKDIKNPNMSNAVLNFLLHHDNELKKYFMSEEAIKFFTNDDANKFVISTFGTFDKEALDSLTKEDILLLVEYMKQHNLVSSYYNTISFPDGMNKEKYGLLKSMIEHEKTYGSKFVKLNELMTTFTTLTNLIDNKEFDVYPYIFEVIKMVVAEIEKENNKAFSSLTNTVQIFTNILCTNSSLKKEQYDLLLIAFNAYLMSVHAEEFSKQTMMTYLNTITRLHDILSDSEFTTKDINVKDLIDNIEFFQKRNIVIDSKNIKYLMVGYEGKESLINTLVNKAIEHVESMGLVSELEKIYTNLVYKFNNKKGFLNMLLGLKKEDFLLQSEMTTISNPLNKFNPSMNLISSKIIMNFVNVNNLNKDMFKKFMVTQVVGPELLQRRCEENEVTSLTPQEVLFLMENAQSYIRTLFFHYVKEGLKVDERLNVLKSLPKDLITRRGSSIIDDTVIEPQPYLVEYHINERIKETDRKELIHLYKEYKHLPKNVALVVHLFKDDYPILEGVNSQDDLIFLMDNHSLIEENQGKTLEEIQMIYVNKSLEVKEFKEFLSVKDEKFFEKHFDNLLKFYKRGLISKSLQYISSVRYNDQLENFKLILKAEIAGRLNEIKFNISDLVEELDMKTINSELANKWFANKLKRQGRFSVKEVSDFQTLFEMGKYPVNSCMSYEGGAYNHCLLSIFDSNKKIVAVYDNEKLVGRAIVRFTKIKEGQVAYGAKGLGFKDIEDIDTESITKEVVDEDETKDLTIFIERLYTNYDSNDKKVMNELIFELMKEKALDLDVKLTISSGYNHVSNLNVKSTRNLSMFISHSKNGKQYLDSLGGNQDEANGGRYYSTSSIYLVNLENTEDIVSAV